MSDNYAKLSKDQRQLVDSQIRSDLSRTLDSEDNHTPLAKAYAAYLDTRGFGVTPDRPLDRESSFVLEKYIKEQRIALSTPESVAALEKDFQENHARLAQESMTFGPEDRLFTMDINGHSMTMSEDARLNLRAVDRMHDKHLDTKDLQSMIKINGGHEFDPANVGTLAPQVPQAPGVVPSGPPIPGAGGRPGGR